MSETGQRPYTIIRLRYKHIKKDYEANRIPMCIDLPSELLKDRVGDRFTFIGEDGVKLLKEYLSSRGTLNDEDLIFVADRSRKGKSKNDPLTPMAISRMFGDIVRQLKLVEPVANRKPAPLRLYSLRKYFRNNLKMDHDYREFLMGHTSTLGVDEHYITRDKEVLRELYSAGYPSLRVYEPTKIENSEQIQSLSKQLTNKDTEIKELERRVDRLTSIMTRLIEGKNNEAFQMAYSEQQSRISTLEAILMDMQKKIDKLGKKEGK